MQLLQDPHPACSATSGWSGPAVDVGGLRTGVSAAVCSSTSDEHYQHVPRGYDVPWGQGPLLIAAAEMAAI